MAVDVNHLVCLFMNIDEILKSDSKLIGKKKLSNNKKLEPCDSRPSPYNPMTISNGCLIIHLDHQNAKMSSKFNPFGLICHL